MARTTPGLRQALKAARTTKRAADREASGDYAVALSAATAGAANLRRQLGRIEGEVDTGLARSQRSLRALTRSARAGQRAVRASEARTVSRYGAALGASVAGSFAPAGATAKATVATVRGAKKAGKATMATADTIQKIAREGAGAQQAAAEYALAQALQQRNILSADQYAAFVSDIYQSALQFEQQKALFEFQLDAQRKAEEGTTLAGLAGVARTTSSAVFDLGDAYRQGDIGTPGEATEWITENYGYAAGSTEHTLLLNAFIGISKQGLSGRDALSAAFDDAYGSYEGYTPGSYADTIAAGADARLGQVTLESRLASGGHGGVANPNAGEWKTWEFPDGTQGGGYGPVPPNAVLIGTGGGPGTGGKFSFGS